jgi:Bacterial SH3 domain
MKRLFVFCLLWASLAAAQTAVVKRNVNLRSDHSTDSDAIDKLTPPAQLQLVEPDPTDGFYHVRTVDNEEGWVWGRNIKILAEAPPSSPTTPSTPSTPSGGTDLFTQLMNARKSAVGKPLIEAGQQVCGPTGDTSNQTAKNLNSNKNRTDVPGDSDYVDVAWNDLKGLPSNRKDDFVGAPVRVIGFLSHRIKVENDGSGESTNCHLLGASEVDWHIYLTNSSAQPISKAIIIETTPRTRPQHSWTTDMLGPLVDSQTQVRISGWLMYDSEHVNVIGTQRATVWEVHPITRIEVQKNGQWVNLDSGQ